MDPRFHRYFDNYFFTIYRKEDTFTVKVGDYLYPEDAEFANINGKTLLFGNDKFLWPHSEFLKFHNRKFEFKQKEFKAAAETKPFDRQDTDGTVVHNFNAIDSWKGKWISNQNVEQYEQLEKGTEINV